MTEETKRPWPLLSDAELDNIPEPNWLIDGFITDEFTVLFGPPTVGKAQPVDEPVLTSDGWRKLDEVAVGDEVIGSSGLPVKVVALDDQGFRDEWEVQFSDGASTRCAADHLWLVRKGYEGRWSVVTTEKLQYSGHHLETHWQIPLVGPVSYRDDGEPLPVDPYVLGVLIGDGGITHGSPILTTGDGEIVEQVARRLPPGCWIEQGGGKSKQYTYRITTERGQPNPVLVGIRALGLAGHRSEEKWVPDEYMTAPPGERLRLLQGLMDADGYVSGGGGSSADFASSSWTLVDNVRELVRSLGGIANRIRVKETQKLPSYAVSFRVPEGVVPFLLHRKVERCSNKARRLFRRVESVRPTGGSSRMKCIQVASRDGLYVTSQYVVTHNSLLSLDWACTVQAGIGWYGSSSIQQTALYVSAEGISGVPSRRTAWRNHRNAQTSNLWTIPHPVDLMDESHADALIDDAVAVNAGFVIVDTLARCMAGHGDENSAQDISAFVKGLDRVREETGAATMLVHHCGYDHSKPRGSTSLFAAADTVIAMMPGTMHGDVVLRCDKQKNGVGFNPMELRLTRIGDSLVLSPKPGGGSGVDPTR